MRSSISEVVPLICLGVNVSICVSVHNIVGVLQSFSLFEAQNIGVYLYILLLKGSITHLAPRNLVLWDFGPMGIWPHRTLAPWDFGPMELGPIGLWPHLTLLPLEFGPMGY